MSQSIISERRLGRLSCDPSQLVAIGWMWFVQKSIQHVAPCCSTQLFWVINDRFYILELWPEVWWSHRTISGFSLQNTVSREPKRRQCFQASAHSWKPEKVQRIKLSFGKTFKMKNIQVVSPSILNCLCKWGYWQVIMYTPTRKCQCLWEFLFSLFSSVVNFLCRYPSS